MLCTVQQFNETSVITVYVYSFQKNIRNMNSYVFHSSGSAEWNISLVATFIFVNEIFKIFQKDV